MKHTHELTFNTILELFLRGICGLLKNVLTWLRPSLTAWPQGSVECVEMPGNANAGGSCVSFGGYEVCSDKFGASPLKGINRYVAKSM